MKALLMVFTILVPVLWNGTWAQNIENPWVPAKGSENPWQNYEVVYGNQASDTTNLTDSTLTVNTSIDTNSVIEEPSLYTQVTEDQNLSDSTSKIELTRREEWKLKTDIRQDAQNEHNSGPVFAGGFVSGLFLNVLAIVPVMIITGSEGPEMERATEKICKDTAYAALDEKEVKQTAQQAIRLKKFATSLAGGLVGTMAQFGIIYLIIS